MTEDIQHTLSVNELLNEKIAIGKEVLKEKEKAYNAKISSKSVNEITEVFKYLGNFVAYLFLGFFKISLFLVILICIGIGINYLIKEFYFVLKFSFNSWHYVQLIYMLLAFLVALYCIKKAYRLGVLRNPFSVYLREFSDKKVTHSSQLEILSVEIKKWEDEKREFLLKHAEKIKKPEEDISSETKECPMCAETIKAKAIICRFCNHKFEPDIIG